jgi:hypothetical protein
MNLPPLRARFEACQIRTGAAWEALERDYALSSMLSAIACKERVIAELQEKLRAIWGN